jgi:uncharacterized membrane protein
MRQILIQEDVTLVEDRLKAFEKATGCELLLVVANSSDPYPAASTRFGLVAGFVLTFIFSLYLDFHHAWPWPVSFFIVTLIMIWVGHFSWAKRLALSDWEVDRECLEKSIEYFHTLGTSKVSHKVTAMIMVSILEKRILILVDEKLKAKINQQDLDELVVQMKKHFKEGNSGLGFIQSIGNLEEKILTAFSGKVSEVNAGELKDTIHFIH